MNFQKLLLCFAFFQLINEVDAKVVKEKLRCISATSQVSLGGAAGSPLVINYSFLFIAHSSSKNLKISDLYIGNEPVEMKWYSLNNGSSTFQKKDTLMVTAKKRLTSILSDSTAVNSEKHSQAKNPFDYKGEALLVYSSCKKKKLLVIPSIEKLAKEYRQ